MRRATITGPPRETEGFFANWAGLLLLRRKCVTMGQNNHAKYFHRTSRPQLRLQQSNC